MPKPGMQNYCKLCDSVWLPQINDRIRRGENARQIGDWLAEASKGALKFSRETLYKHRDNTGGHHITDTVPAADMPIIPPGQQAITVANVPERTNDDLLGKVRDIAFADLEANPSQVTLKMGLEAVKILEGRKQQKTNVMVLAKIFTGQANPRTSEESIEGEFTEMPAAPAQIEEIASGD